MAIESFNKIKVADIHEYMKDKSAEEKKAFKEVAFDENGKYQHIKAKRYFCEKYFPKLVPVKKDKAPNKADIFKDW